MTVIDSPVLNMLEMLRKEAPFFMRQLCQLDVSGVAGRHTLPVLMTQEKSLAIKAIAEKKDFPGLDGDALKAAEAILKMAKPWGPGSACDLCESLGDWDGEITKKNPKSRANTLGRYLKKLQFHLADKGVILEIRGGKFKYKIREEIREKEPTTAVANTVIMSATGVPFSTSELPETCSDALT
jgi:hypothetical protein